jgi:hypothetical protein
MAHLLDLRDRNEPVTYTAAPRLRAADRAGTRPRAVWLKPSMSDQLRDRCEADRVSLSEFALEGLRRYLKSRSIDINPPI